MEEKKSKIIIYLCALIFLAAGVYLTFFMGSTSKYDSQTKAYRIYPNESSDSDGNSTYSPIYYFNVDGQEYECKTKTGSSSYPSESKNTVYYDSTNPTNCKTEYEKSSGKVAGIICLVATAVIVYFFIIRKPSQVDQSYLREDSGPIDEEKAQKVISVINKVSLIYKRIVLGVFILILLVLILIETAIVKQTIKAKDYIETTAAIVVDAEKEEDSVFDNYLYNFVDKDGATQGITISVSKGESPQQEVKIKYNPTNPQEFYEESATFDKSGIIWYIVKIVALVLLVILFFCKKLLNKIGISGKLNVNG